MKKIVVAHYEIVVTVPEGSSHRDVIEAWLSSTAHHETLENIIAEDHRDIAAECEIEVSNQIVVCPTCRGQHEMDEVYEMDDEAEEGEKTSTKTLDTVV